MVRNGTGPAYLLGVNSADPGSIDIAQFLPDARGWRGQKTPWVVHSSYKGPTLIRGKRLDRPGGVTFAENYGQHLTEIRWPAGTGVRLATAGYRSLPLTTLFKKPGCYGFQADGLSFTATVVVRVTGAP